MREVKASELRSKELNPLFQDPAVMRALEMLGIDPALHQDNILLWIDTVKNIESSGGKNTSNKERVGEDGTTAKGNYQFTDATFRSYLQSYKNALEDVGEELPTWAWAEYNKGDMKDADPRRLTDLQQQILLVVGTHARGKDEEIVPAWTGDLEDAGADLFYNVHYGGSPDLITRFVVNREFKKNAKKAVSVIPDLPEPAETANVPATMLGDLMIKEDEEVKGTPIGVSDFPFPSKDDLEEVTPTQRGQVPIPEGEKLEEVEVPRRRGMFPEAVVSATRVDETPPPRPTLDPVTPTQRGQVPILGVEYAPPPQAHRNVLGDRGKC